MAQESHGADQSLPFERTAKSPADVNADLLTALGSEPGFEETEGESEAPADEGVEPEPAESEDDEPEEGDEPEDESEEGEEEESEQEEEPAAEPIYEVHGERVTLQGLKDGFLRQADYTRKTQALAEDRRKDEAERAELRRARDQYAERLEGLALALNEATPKRDWAKLEAEDPAAFTVEWAKHQRREQERAKIEAEQRKVHDERLADWERGQTAYLEEQKRLLHQAIPEWRDPVKEKAEKQRVAEYLTETYGWTDEDLATVQDHRLMVALRKAMLYDEGQTNGKAKLQGKIKPAGQALKPGSPVRSPKREQRAQIRRTRERLSRSGRVEDAAAHFENFLDD